MKLASLACSTTRRRSTLETSFNAQGGKWTSESSRNLAREESHTAEQMETTSRPERGNLENKSDLGCRGMKGRAGRFMGPKTAVLGGHHLGREGSDVKGKIRSKREISHGWRIENDKKDINSNHDSFHCKLQLMFRPLSNCVWKLESW